MTDTERPRRVTDRDPRWHAERRRAEKRRTAESGLLDLMLYYGTSARIPTADLAERLAQRVVSDLEEEDSR